MIESGFFYACAIPAIFIDGISKGGFGGGLGVIAVPIMALAIDPVQAAAIMLPILVLMDISNLWAYRGKWDRREARLLIGFATIGILIGAISFHVLNEDAVRILLGLISVTFALNWWVKKFNHTPIRQEPYNVRKGGFWGVVGGFTSFIAHAGGPPFSVYLLPRKLDKTTLQATTAISFAFTNLIKLLPYALLGQLSMTNVSTSLALLPAGMAGLAVGIWAHKRLPDKWFYSLMYAFLILLGIKLLYSGVSGFLSTEL